MTIAEEICSIRLIDSDLQFKKFVNETLAALQLERDALREALLPFKPSDTDVFAYIELAHPDKPRKYPITVTDRDLLRVHSLLSSPASGEPARKP